MKRSWITRLAIVVAAMSLVAAACGDDDDDGDSGSTDTTEEESASRENVDGVLKFGTLVPQTGRLSVIVESLTTPIEIAVQEINDAGGVLGEEVIVVPGDDGTAIDVARTTYGRLVNTDQVDAILGPAPSDVAEALLENFETDEVVACTGSATAASLSGVGGGLFYRTAPPDRLQGPALANLILADQHTQVAIMALNDAYGSGFAEALAAGLEDSGATVTDTVLYDPDASGYDAEVQQVVASQPEAVAVIGFNDDGAKVINAMIGEGVGPADIPIYTADGMQSSAFAETVDPADPSKVAGIQGTAPAAAPVGVEHPFQAQLAAENIDPIFSSYFYDCTMILALAAQSAGSDDGADIAEAVDDVLTGDEDCQTYADCLALLEEGSTIHYRGASNTFDTWDVMEPGSGAYEIWSYNEAGEVVTEPPEAQIKIEG